MQNANIRKVMRIVLEYTLLDKIIKYCFNISGTIL